MDISAGVAMPRKQRRRRRLEYNSPRASTTNLLMRFIHLHAAVRLYEI